MVRIGIPTEIAPGERRVAVVPDTVKALVKAGASVLVQAGAGAKAFYFDPAYTDAGATIVPDAASLWSQADVVLKINPPLPAGPGGADEADALREGAVLICLLNPLSNLDLVKRLRDRRITSFSMDAVPRSTRAQRMDVLSSMATVAGYKAAIIAAEIAPKFFPMFVTAAGTIAPSRVLVVGAGVAGLQAIATARRLGAVVEGFDIRPAVKEEVESLGATFIGPKLTAEEAQDAQGYAKPLSAEKQKEAQDLLKARVAQADVIITTARIPGRAAPRLIDDADVARMKPGSVILDLAADSGGNCEGSVAGETVVRHDVTIVGPTQLDAMAPVHASQMYSRNLLAFVQLLLKEGVLNLNFEDDIVRDTCITHEGTVRHAATRDRLGAAAPAPATTGGVAS
jgi:NAD(P) transhydrogenase subunit alpha